VASVINACCVKIGLLETVLALLSNLEIFPHSHPDFMENSFSYMHTGQEDPVPYSQLSRRIHFEA
jgi:hypothetical protein